MRQKMPCDNRARAQNDESAGQGAPRADSHHRSWKRQGRILPYRPCRHLDLALPAPRPLRQYTSVVSKLLNWWDFVKVALGN